MTKMIGMTMAALGLALAWGVPANAQAPTVKSLVANRGSIVAGDITFSNFQVPAALPYTFLGPVAPTDGSDIAVAATTPGDGRIGLIFTPIDPVTDNPKPWAVGNTTGGGGGGGGGKGGGGGSTLPTDTSRLVTYDVTITNPNLLMSSSDVATGAASTTGVGTGYEGMVYYVDPVTGAPYIQIWDTYFANQDSKSYSFNTVNQSFGGRVYFTQGGSPAPGGYQRSLRYGVQMMLGPYFGLGTGTATISSYTVSYSLIPANTPPVTAPATLLGFALTSSAASPLHGILQLSGPAGPNFDVTLTSSAPSVLTVAPTVTIPASAQSFSFPVATAQVAVDTLVTVAASLNGVTLSFNYVVPAVQPFALSSVTVPSSGFTVVGGAIAQGVVSTTAVVQGSPVTVALSSSDPTVLVPASVTVPVGASFAIFSVTTPSVTVAKNVTVTASYGATSVSGAFWLTPPVRITSCNYLSVSRKLNVTAVPDASTPNSVLTFGTNVNGPALGTLSFSAWVWIGKASTNTAPAQCVVWSSAGGMATMPVTVLNQ